MLLIKGRFSIGYIGKSASMGMLTLFESRYTLKGRYSIKPTNLCMCTGLQIYVLGGILSLIQAGYYFTFLKNDGTLDNNISREGLTQSSALYQVRFTLTFDHLGFFEIPTFKTKMNA